MPNIAALLKDEIARISRKEIRRLADPLKKQVAAQRQDIAMLKRERDALKREIAAVRKSSGKAVKAEAPSDTQTRVRFSAAGLRTLRGKLGLSAGEFAQLIGASAQSVYNWEHEKARPRQAQLQRIASLRGIGKREASKQLEAQATATKRASKRKE